MHPISRNHLKMSIMSNVRTGSILIANHLLDGDVLFMGAKDWVLDHREARIVSSDEDKAALEALGKRDMHQNLVVDAYLVDVTIGEDGVPEPVHYREKMRTKGPSNRLDLGKQAEQAAGRSA